MPRKTIYTLGILGTVWLLYNFYQIFLVVPIDELQGNIFRIIFIHVPAAFTAFTFYGVAVVASIAFLVTKNFKWDSMAVSAVEVGTMFTLVNLATGSIWGRVEWGIWWAWDARMTSQLMCFLLYLGYLLMRPAIAEPQQRGVMSAVLAIFAAADIPIVLSARSGGVDIPRSFLAMMKLSRSLDSIMAMMENFVPASMAATSGTSEAKAKSARPVRTA